MEGGVEGRLGECTKKIQALEEQMQDKSASTVGKSRVLRGPCVCVCVVFRLRTMCDQVLAFKGEVFHGHKLIPKKE